MTELQCIQSVIIRKPPGSFDNLHSEARGLDRQNFPLAASHFQYFVLYNFHVLHYIPAKCVRVYVVCFYYKYNQLQVNYMLLSYTMMT